MAYKKSSKAGAESQSSNEKFEKKRSQAVRGPKRVDNVDPQNPVRAGHRASGKVPGRRSSLDDVGMA